MNKKNFSTINKLSWPISRRLLFLILEDKVSDVFVCKLVWERLFYIEKSSSKKWASSQETPLYWSKKFLEAPQIISERPASIHLTRSIPAVYKQGLKEFLKFEGYKIKELYPRRTRRATAVNWLIYWSIESNNVINESDNLPALSHPSSNPVMGHKGDPDIK